MAKKPGIVVAHDEGNSPIMSHDPLTTYSREVMWQIKSLMSPIPQNLWPPNLTGGWLMIRRIHAWCHMTLWLRGYVMSRDKLKAWYLLFQKVYDHQTLQITHFWRRKLVVRSHDKLKTKYLLLHNACDQRTWQDGDL